MKGIFTSRPILNASIYTCVLIALFTIPAFGQCVEAPDDPCVSVRQSTIDRAMKAVTELKEARVAIEALQKVSAATDTERAAYKNALDVSAAAIAIFQKGVADRDALIALQDKAIQAVMQLNEKLIQQMGKPKSAWSKFLNAVKTIVTLAAGVSIGKGL